MAITFVNSFTSNTTSCSFSGVQSGDFILAHATNRATLTLGGAPSGWALCNFVAANSTLGESQGVYYKVSNGTETSITVTNAKEYSVLIYRPSSGNLIAVGDTGQKQVGPATTQTIPALAPVASSGVAVAHIITIGNPDPAPTVTNPNATFTARTSIGGELGAAVNKTWDAPISSTFGTTTFSAASSFSGIIGVVTLYEVPTTSMFVRGIATLGNTCYLTDIRNGDLLIASAYRSSSATAPSAASGWTTLQTGGASTNSLLVASKVATGGEASVTFTNATQVEVVVYRPPSGFALQAGASVRSGGTGTTATIPALTLQDTDGSSWVTSIVGSRTDTTEATPPTGLKTRSTINPCLGMYDTGTGVSSWASTTKTVTNTGWATAAVEVMVIGPPVISSPSSYNQVEGSAFSTTLTADQTVTWSIVGGSDQALFSVTGSTLSLPAQSRSAPADSNSDNVYNVTVRATATATGFVTDKTMSVTITVAPWTPALLGSSLKAWYDASDSSSMTLSSDRITLLQDKSGNANHLSNGGFGPPFGSTFLMGSYPAIQFNQGGYLSGVWNSGGSNSWNVFSVYQTLTDSTNVRIVAFENSSGGADYDDDPAMLVATQRGNSGSESISSYHGGTYAQSPSVTFNSSQAHISGITCDGINQTGWLDGTSGTPVSWTPTNPTVTPVYAEIGGRSNGAGAIDGYISEVVIVAGTLTDGDRQKIEGYLAWSYGLQGLLPSGHPYASAAPTAGGATSTDANVSITGVSSSGTVGVTSGQSATSVSLSGVSGSAVIGSVSVSSTINDTVSVAGLSSTGAIGSLTFATTGSATLAGVSSTTVVGTISQSASKSLTGLAATSALGSITHSQSLSVTGLSAASALGSVSVTGGASATLVGLQAASALGSATARVDGSAALIGLAATGAIGPTSTTNQNSLTGLAAAGSVGSVAYLATVALTGMSATSAIGALATQVNDTLTLSGLSATSALGNIIAQNQKTATGVSATGAIGSTTASISVFAPFLGLQATGSVGTLASGPQFVTWENLVAFVDSGSGTATFPGGGTYFGQATSVQKITSGDGYFEFTYDGHTEVWGVTSGAVPSTSGGTASLQFSMGITVGLGGADARVNGVYIADCSPYSPAAGDVYRIEISGGNVYWKRNGVTYATATAPTLTYPYYAVVRQQNEIPAAGTQYIGMTINPGVAASSTLNTALTTALSGIQATSALGDISVGSARNMSITGLSMTGAAGTTNVGLSPNVSIDGLLATTALGTTIPAPGPALTGVSATSAIGSLTFQMDDSASITGLQATGSVGSVNKQTAPQAVGVSANGVTGSAIPNVQVPVTGLSVTSALGVVGKQTGPQINGTSATSAIGSTTSFQISTAVPLPSVSVSGIVGIVGATAGTGTSVSGVAGIGAVGSVSKLTFVSIGAVSAVSALGNLSKAASVSIAGLAGATAMGSVLHASSLSLNGIQGASAVGDIQTFGYASVNGLTASGSVGVVAASGRAPIGGAGLMMI